MQCPNCPNQLTATLYEGVDIRYCPSCKGSLLDEQKLGEIERKREVVISREQGHTKSNHYEDSQFCPDCDIAMEKTKYGKYVPRTIDKCPQCNNIWLDEGELEDIQVAYEMYEENTKKAKKP
jgi:Zn-finger nucleic acid-binding protein